MRPIDADALIAKWEEDAKHIEVFDHRGMVYAAINELKNAPTVDPEPKQNTGRWLHRATVPTDVMCSRCGSIGNVKDFGIPLNYCPNCGAKMEKEEADETD